MKKIWLLAKITYRQRVRSGAFLFLTLGLPAIMIIAGAIPILLLGRGEPPPALGYVDHTDSLAPVERISLEDTSLELIPYPAEEAARMALQRAEIGGYLVIPPDYLEGEQPLFYGEEAPGRILEAGLTAFMRQAMLPDRPAWLLDRLEDPAEISYVAQSSNIEISEGFPLVFRIIAPLVLAMAFAFMVLTGANQMGSAIVQEKEQRSMEMVITSLLPRELVAGKVLGLALLSFTQLAVWAAGAVIALSLAMAGALIQGQSVIIPWSALLWFGLLGIPGYFLYAVLAAGLGIVAGDSRQAQQLAGFLGLVGLAPIWFTGVLVQAPNGAAAIGLTLFPLTAPMVSLIRMAMADVPTWQLALSFIILIISLALSIPLVARIFRTAMLMYGQTLRPRQLLQTLLEA